MSTIKLNKGVININTFYTAYQVLKDYITGQGYTIANFSLIHQCPDRVIIWVDDNAKNITHYVCVQMSPTMFVIWGYDNNYKMVDYTSYDYADVNTPTLKTEE